MTIPAKLTLMVQIGPNQYEEQEVQFNPTELSFDVVDAMAIGTVDRCTDISRPSDDFFQR